MNFLNRRALLLAGCAAGLLGGLAAADDVRAQAWKPSRTIEYVVPSGPGAALDAAARQLAQLLERMKLVQDPIVVANRSGGAGTIAIQTLMQHKGTRHWIATFTTGMINARAIGDVTSTYLDTTPIAVILEESIVVAVRDDSPIRTVKDFVEVLRKEPDGLSIGIATSVGNHIHVGVAQPLQTAGVDVSRLRMVPFRSSADSMTALLGGHLDVVTASTPNVIAQMQAGKIRVLAVASAERLPGILVFGTHLDRVGRSRGLFVGPGRARRRRISRRNRSGSGKMRSAARRPTEEWQQLRGPAELAPDVPRFAADEGVHGQGIRGHEEAVRRPQADQAVIAR